MTWRADAAGYEVFFNRDESHARKPALPPELRLCGGLRALAPTDGDCGGTWIAVNEAGLTACLLNGSGAADRPPAAWRSRGEIPLALAGAATVVAAAAELRRQRLEQYRPFAVVVLAGGGRGLCAAWSGRELDLRMELPADQPLVSSSFCTEEVRSTRVAVFRRMREQARGPTRTLHLDYHRCHEPCAGPHSPCMHRPDAATVSFSWIEVGPRQVRFHYAARAPCVGPLHAPVLLERTAA